MNIEQTVIDAFINYYEADSNYSTSKDLVEDYNMDVIDLAQIAIRLNDKYALNFVWEDFDRLNTVQSISEMVEAKLQSPDVPEKGGSDG